MKKLFIILASLMVSLGFSSCTNEKTKLVISDVKITDKAVDKQALDNYFLSNESLYPAYSVLKSNCPNLLDNAKVLKSDLNKNSQLIKFSFDNNGFLDGATFLHIDDTYYQLGVSFGGYGVTQFAHYKNENSDLLYFIYSFGSGIHRSHVGVFDLNSKSIGEVDLNLGLSQPEKDFTFVEGEDNSFNLNYALIHFNDDGYTYFIKEKELFYSGVEKASLNFCQEPIEYLYINSEIF